MFRAQKFLGLFKNPSLFKKNGMSVENISREFLKNTKKTYFKKSNILELAAAAKKDYYSK